MGTRSELAQARIAMPDRRIAQTRARLDHMYAAVD